MGSYAREDAIRGGKGRCLSALVFLLLAGALAWIAGCEKDGGTKPAPEPPLEYSVSPLSLAFDSLSVWDAGSPRSFRIRNLSDKTITADIASSGREFWVESGDGRSQLAAGDSVVVQISFAPRGTGIRTGWINTGLPGFPKVTCTGVGLPVPRCTVIPDTLDFGSLRCETCSEERFIRITPQDRGAVWIEYYLDDLWPPLIFPISPLIGIFRVAAGDTARIAVRFCPDSPGPRLFEMTLGPDRSVRLVARGTGLPPNPGACCDPVTGDCRIAERVECDNSCWRGADSICPPTAPCLPEMGVCCDPLTAECRFVSCDGCTRGWLFRTDGSTCCPNNCPVPVLKSSDQGEAFGR